MKYLIHKQVNNCNYWIQEYRSKAVWNGVKDNAKEFDREHLAHAYMLLNKIRDGETKLKNQP
jgi:hypothetical protein